MDSTELYEALMALDYKLNRFEDKKAFEKAREEDVWLDMVLDKLSTVVESVNMFKDEY
jgi:hypothetical protein